MNEILNKIFANHGVLIENNEENEQLYLSSVTFISIIIEIEKEFEISIPDAYLDIDRLNTYYDFIIMIENLIK